MFWYLVFAFADFLAIAAASLVILVISTEYFPLILSLAILHNPHSGASLAILHSPHSGVGESSCDNETHYVGETG